jgi:hypothetical protein
MGFVAARQCAALASMDSEPAIIGAVERSAVKSVAAGLPAAPGDYSPRNATRQKGDIAATGGSLRKGGCIRSSFFGSAGAKVSRWGQKARAFHTKKRCIFTNISIGHIAFLP